jgi:hypothetical protein
MMGAMSWTSGLQLITNRRNDDEAFRLEAARRRTNRRTVSSSSENLASNDRMRSTIRRFSIIKPSASRVPSLLGQHATTAA